VFAPLIHLRQVIIASPYPVSRLGIRTLISSLCSIDEIQEADSPMECALTSGEEQDALLIFELSPKGLQADALYRCFEKRSEMRSIALIDPSVPCTLCRALLERGLKGILPQQISSREWQTCFQQVLGGKTYLCRHIRAALCPEALPPKRPSARHPLASLSNREVQVFQYLGCGRSSKLIAELLSLSIKTIETHQEHLKEKLGAASKSELVQMAKDWVADGIIRCENGQ
jgi:DNA-binding NarL/FixJ family response regulator